MSALVVALYSVLAQFDAVKECRGGALNAGFSRGFARRRYPKRPLYGLLEFNLEEGTSLEETLRVADLMNSKITSLTLTK